MISQRHIKTQRKKVKHKNIFHCFKKNLINKLLLKFVIINEIVEKNMHLEIPFNFRYQNLQVIDQIKAIFSNGKVSFQH